MLFSRLLAVMGLQAHLAMAGNAVFHNRCHYDIWLWSVTSASSSEAIHVPARSHYSEAFCDKGTSFKVSKTNQLVAGAHTQFEYSIVDNVIWFDISLVNCVKDKDASACPGHSQGLAIDSPNRSCGHIACSGGSYCPTQAYFVDTPMQKLGLKEPVFTCPGAGTDLDLNMKICSDNAPLQKSIAGRMLTDMAA